MERILVTIDGINSDGEVVKGIFEGLDSALDFLEELEEREGLKRPIKDQITQEKLNTIKHALEKCHKSLNTYGTHPIIDSQTEKALKYIEDLRNKY